MVVLGEAGPELEARLRARAREDDERRRREQRGEPDGRSPAPPRPVIFDIEADPEASQAPEPGIRRTAALRRSSPRRPPRSVRRAERAEQAGGASASSPDGDGVRGAEPPGMSVTPDPIAGPAGPDRAARLGRQGRRLCLLRRRARAVLRRARDPLQRSAQRGRRHVAGRRMPRPASGDRVRLRVAGGRARRGGGPAIRDRPGSRTRDRLAPPPTYAQSPGAEEVSWVPVSLPPCGGASCWTSPPPPSPGGASTPPRWSTSPTRPA